MASRTSTSIVKRLLIPVLVTVYVTYLLIYTHHSSPAPPIWDLLYFVCDPLFIFLLSGVMIGLIYFDKITFWDIQFLIVCGLFNIMRFVCYYGNYFGWITHTYNFIVITYGTVVGLIIIIANIIRVELAED